MFKFFSTKGEEVFASNNLEEVEQKAAEYKTKNNLLSLAICKSNGSFFKWA